MNRSRLGSQLLTLSTGLVAGRALTFAQGVLLARLLGAVDLGKYAALLSICWLISRIGDFGLPHAFSHYARTIDNSLGSLLRVAGINTLIGCVVSAIALACLTFLPVPIFQEVRASLPWIVVLYLCAVLGTVGNLLPVFLMAAGDYRNYVLFFNAGVAAQIALQTAMFFLIGPTLIVFFVATILSQGGMTAILLLHLMRVRSRQRNAQRVSAGQCYRFGLKTYWGVMMKLTSTRLEVPLIASFMAPALVGYYSVASNLREAALVPQQLYSGIFQNELIDRGKSQGVAAGSLLIKAVILQFLMSIGISLGALLLLPLLIPWLYGPTFVAAVTPAVILVTSTIFSGMAGLCWIGFNAENKPHLIGVVTTISGVLSPLCIYVFASKYGLVGVASASVAASFVTFVITALFTIRLNSFEWADVGRALRELKALASHASKSRTPLGQTPHL